MPTRIVRGHHPEPTVRIRSTVNDGEQVVRVSHAATLLTDGTAELIGEPTEALTAAIATYRSIPAVRRNLEE